MYCGFTMLGLYIVPPFQGTIMSGTYCFMCVCNCSDVFHFLPNAGIIELSAPSLSSSLSITFGNYYCYFSTCGTKLCR